MNIVEERQRVARLTAQCRRVEYEWRAPEATRYSAWLWCNEIGEDVVGYGPDEWTAVQAAHARREMESNRGY